MKILDYIERFIRYISPQGRRERRGKEIDSMITALKADMDVFKVGKNTIYAEPGIYKAVKIKTVIKVAGREVTETVEAKPAQAIRDVADVVREMKDI